MRGAALLTFALLTMLANVASAKKKKPKTRPPAAAPAAVATPEQAPIPAATPLEAAIQLYQNAQFAESIAALDKLYRQTTDLPTRKQAKLYWGMNFLSLGNEPQAQVMFQDLLDLDPDFLLPTFTSPSVKQFFLRVKATYKIIPLPTHLPPAEIDATKGADLQVSIVRMRPGYQATLYYRPQGAAAFSRLDLALVGVDRYTGRLPPALLVKDKGYALEYFIRVTDGPEHELATLRTITNPFVVPVSVPVQLAQGTPVYKKWWLWTIVGGVIAAAAATTAILLVTSQTPPTGQANVVLKF